MSPPLRSSIIRLAHTNPELRPVLLPLVMKTAYHEMCEAGSHWNTKSKKCEKISDPSHPHHQVHKDSEHANKWSDVATKKPGNHGMAANAHAVAAGRANNEGYNDLGMGHHFKGQMERAHQFEHEEAQSSKPKSKSKK